MLDRTRKSVGHEKKEKWGWEKRNKEQKQEKASTWTPYDKFHTKSCMVAYEW